MKPSFAWIVLSLCLSSAAFAEGGSLRMSQGPSNELVLTDTSCQKLFKQRDALCEWKKTLDPDFIIPPSSATTCRPVRGGRVSISVSSCLPDFAKSYAKKKLVRNGPNCWGTAMSFHGLSKKPRFLWPEEMQYWLDSPVCRKLNVGEPMLPGDVINVYYPEYIGSPADLEKDAGTKFWEALYPNRYTPLPRLDASGYTGYNGSLHAVTYVSPEIAFGKDSPSKDDPFYFHPMNEVYGRPGSGEVNGPTPESRACQENQSLTPYLREYQKPPKNIRESACSYFSLAYRCGDIPKYFSEQNLSTEEQQIWQLVQTLQATQETLFPFILSLSTPVDRAELTRRVFEADAIVLQASQALAVPGISKTQEMLLTLEYFSAAGIRQTLEQADLTPVR
jgi:hypothetical protein